MEFKEYVLRQMAIIRANAENFADEREAAEENSGSAGAENSSDAFSAADAVSAADAGNGYERSDAGNVANELDLQIKPRKLFLPANENNSEIDRLFAELDNLAGLNLIERILFA